jgi:hypothetical protein
MAFKGRHFNYLLIIQVMRRMTGVSLAALAARDTPSLQLCVITKTLV